jgi:hypothetical protein
MKKKKINKKEQVVIKSRDILTEKMLIHTKPGPHIKNTNKQKRKKAKMELKNSSVPES